MFLFHLWTYAIILPLANLILTLASLMESNFMQHQNYLKATDEVQVICLCVSPADATGTLSTATILTAEW